MRAVASRDAMMMRAKSPGLDIDQFEFLFRFHLRRHRGRGKWSDRNRQIKRQSKKICCHWREQLGNHD
jgi:hypothetical protein